MTAEGALSAALLGAAFPHGAVVLGLGIDLCEIDRIDEALARHGRRFLERICVPGEVRRPIESRRIAEHVAGLFAAKEATMKALGTGWAAGVGFLQIEVVRQASGSPGLQLHGAAHRRAESLGVGRLWLSISHDGPTAVAVVVLECVRNE